MEFSSRGFQRNTNPRPSQDGPTTFGSGTPAPNEPRPNGESKLQHALHTVRSSKFLYGLNLALSVSLLILFVAVIIGISFGPNSKELSAINKDGYQVVALADGQAYFGKIVGITESSVILRDVFYLNSESSSAGADSNNIQLVKRGCEVHGPSNQMILYRQQVNFWENLKTDGRVAKGIEQWNSQNPKGQNCDDQNAAPTQQPTTNNESAPSTTSPSTQNSAPSSNSNTSPSTPSTNNSSNNDADSSTNNSTVTDPANP